MKFIAGPAAMLGSHISSGESSRHEGSFIILISLDGLTVMSGTWNIIISHIHCVNHTRATGENGRRSKFCSIQFRQRFNSAPMEHSQ